VAVITTTKKIEWIKASGLRHVGSSKFPTSQ